MDIVFVVLHYTAVQETIKCVEAIRKQIDTKKYKIIVVDNCSPDDSWNVLNDRFSENTDIVLLQTEENLGFAKGNNIGYRYAKEKFKPHFIVLMNNDVMLFQSNMYQKIEKKYKQYAFAVMGPMIITGDGRIVSNPQRRTLMTKEQAIRSIKRYQRYQLLNRFGCDELYKAMIARVRKYIPPVTVEERIGDMENVGLDGSCWIFSEKYIHMFDGLDERTFLYVEEDILLLHILKRGLKTLYTPDLAVYHKEDAATDVVHRKAPKKNAFIYKHCIDSLKAYCEVFDSYQQ